MKKFEINNIITLKIKTICQHQKQRIKFARHKILDITSYKDEKQFIIAPVNNWDETVGTQTYLVNQSDCY